MEEGVKMDYQGKCYRHVLRFKPSPQFDNNCPACYWEGEAARLAVKLERIEESTEKDGPVYIKNVGNGSFVTIEKP